LYMKNPYFELHKEFKAAGANVLMSSGQACVLFGIATFSKDGGWVVEERPDSCMNVLKILEKKKAFYRLGAPLDIRWLSKGLTSHFEYFTEDNFRMRVDFCSRPPRVKDINAVWHNAGIRQDVNVVDVSTLIALKQTKRVRDYNIIGTLAEVLGFNQGEAALAIEYLQDYDLLKKAVDKWPDLAKTSKREAVKSIVQGKSRKDTVVALAVEQDEKIQADARRISEIKEKSKAYQREFMNLNKEWRTQNQTLLKQHADLLIAAESLLL